MNASPADTQSLWIGIDVAKATVEAAILLPDGQAPTKRFARTPEGMAALVDWARALAPGDASLRACLETTGRYSVEAIAWLVKADASLAPACVHALHAKRFAQSLGLRNKTDAVDARMLARMGAERRPAPHEEPRPVVAELRALVRERRVLVEERTRLKNRSGEKTTIAALRRSWKAQEKALDAQIKALEAEIKRVVKNDEELARDVEQLCTIPGVGHLTAVTVLAELGDLRRFATSRQLSAFAGVSPRRYESGTSVRGRTRMSKKGSPTARAALYMAAVSAATHKGGAFTGFYQRLVGAGKEPKAALGAVMRKLLVLMRALLVRGEVYRRPVENRAPGRELALA
jgi:transposase